MRRRLSLETAVQNSPRVKLARRRARNFDRVFCGASLKLGARARVDTVYKIGSVTEQSASTAALLLVEDGRLKLDDFGGDDPTSIPAARTAAASAGTLTASTSV